MMLANRVETIQRVIILILFFMISPDYLMGIMTVLLNGGLHNTPGPELKSWLPYQG